MDEILKNALEEHGGTDVVIPYSQVAWVFPSEVPHPDSFEYKVIDENRLLSWARKNSWKVEKIPTQAGSKNSPLIRFTQIKALRKPLRSDIAFTHYIATLSVHKRLSYFALKAKLRWKPNGSCTA